MNMTTQKTVMTMNRRRASAALVSVGFAPLALTQGIFPAKPIRLLVPWVAGTPADLGARIVSDRMGIELGQPVHVDNKNGAAGTVAVRDVMRAFADCHTLYMLAWALWSPWCSIPTAASTSSNSSMPSAKSSGASTFCASL